LSAALACHFRLPSPFPNVIVHTHNGHNASSQLRRGSLHEVAPIISARGFTPCDRRKVRLNFVSHCFPVPGKKQIKHVPDPRGYYAVWGQLPIPRTWESVYARCSSRLIDRLVQVLVNTHNILSPKSTRLAFGIQHSEDRDQG
jgi:hypothetical protein